MQSDKQIGGKSVENQPQIAQVITAEPHNPHSIKKRKYDRREFNGNIAHLTKPGPISQHYKRLSRTNAVKTLKALDAIASLAQIYELAFNRSELNLCVQIRENLANRAFGKPFVAVNPDDRKPAANVFNDNRIQMAIQQLLPGAKPAKPRKSKAKSLPAAPELT